MLFATLCNFISFYVCTVIRFSAFSFLCWAIPSQVACKSPDVDENCSVHKLSLLVKTGSNPFLEEKIPPTTPLSETSLEEAAETESEPTAEPSPTAGPQTGSEPTAEPSPTEEENESEPSTEIPPQDEPDEIKHRLNAAKEKLKNAQKEVERAKANLADAERRKSEARRAKEKLAASGKTSAREIENAKNNLKGAQRRSSLSHAFLSILKKELKKQKRLASNK